MGACISWLLFAVGVVLLFAARTTATTLGPWEVVKPIFFAIVATQALVLLMIARDKRTPLTAFYCATGAYIGMTTAVTAIVYPLGFGFDPILHRAAETVIATQGFIDPRTFYYGGHYGLVTTLSSALSVAPAMIDRFIVPLLAALSIPVIAYRTFLFAASKQGSRIGTTIIALALPIVSLGSGTPWGYAMLLTIITILASILLQFHKNKTSLALLSLSTLSLLAVHPLAGLPVGCIAVASVITAFRTLSVWGKIGIVCVAALSLPAAFIANSLVSPQLPVSLMRPDIASVISALVSKFTPHWGYRFNAPLDLAYLFIQNSPIFLLLFGSIGSLSLLRSRSDLNQRIGTILALGAGAMLASFIILRGFLSFPSLPEYEQAIYPDRMAEIAFIFLLIAATYALQKIMRFISVSSSAFFTLIFFLFVSIAAATHVYASYPRNDAYTPYHGYTLAKSDIDAVRWIAAHAGNEEYIVMANQVVAAASIQEFGFFRYYPIQTAAGAVEQFYYPIPTGSPLSALYREMLADPSRSVIERAMRLVGVTRAYFVVNRYEPRFRTIIEHAKKDANDMYVIGDDTATILFYRF